ncbi:MAG: DUF2301 domain-containing membrane protein [Scytonematopsis contorta HA4267-MV1]|jgi:uncharacterized integral membrane protein|nr:DUF2301 domain-containing membrane protein [Scytonematopsis contorta HA4267-MV1]
MVYQGQFGEFTITEGDRKGVVVYRAGLMVAAISFAIGSTIVLYNNNFGGTIDYHLLTPLYTIFMLGIGVSLFTIHIYMAALHRALQAFWLIGCISSFIFGHFDTQPFVVTIYTHPLSILGVGFSFAALTGIYFKEAFCFNRFETKILTPIVPLLLLGHLAGVLPTQWEQIFLGIWALLFMVFAMRKAVQAIPPDIGDKSVFEYLKSQRLVKAS